MLYRTIERLIDLGRTEGLREKIDIFYVAGRLSENEYNRLIVKLV